jgi:hypothetical protein
MIYSMLTGSKERLTAAQASSNCNHFFPIADVRACFTNDNLLAHNKNFFYVL